MFQNFVSIGGWNIVVTICNTLITFLIVKKFLFKPVRKMLAARAEEVQAMYDQAESDRAEAAAMKKDYTESIANAKAEATQITQTATRRATVRSEEILAEASRQATDMKRKAEQSIEQERKKAMNEIKDEIAGQQYYFEEGICEVTAVTASPMDADLTEKLKEKMCSVTGKKVVLQTRVDPSILGGIVVKVDNKQIDTSVKTRLEELAQQLTQTIA